MAVAVHILSIGVFPPYFLFYIRLTQPKQYGAAKD